MQKQEGKTGRVKVRKSFGPILAFCLFACVLATVLGQAGRRARPANQGALSLNVVAKRDGDSTEPITSKQISLYDNGVEQSIQNFSIDPSPARIVLLVDNSLSVRADVEKLEAAAREFAYEIYEGDKLLIVGYDEQPEIVADWTDDAKQVETSIKSFRKKGQPFLFDALNAVVEDALRPISGQTPKRIIVIIGDGLDRGSKTHFDDILSTLQALDITVYAVQAPDRTRGALRRDQPKPEQVIQKLTEGTGGRAFPINEPTEAAKAICDELRKNRYLLSYEPTSFVYDTPHRLLLIADPGINIRSKTFQPQAQ